MATRSDDSLSTGTHDASSAVDLDAPFMHRDTRRYESPSAAEGMATVSDVRPHHLVRVTGDRQAAVEDTLAGPGSVPLDATLPGPGDIIDGQFEIVRAIGRGGMGHVYLGRDLDLGRQVAIKIMRIQSARRPNNDKMLELFKREARATAQLNHPNVVTIHQVGQWREQPYLVLELLRGESLARRLQDGSLGVASALRIMTEVCRGLDHAHHAGLVHRDLKPGNIFLTQDGVAKVLDFGLAQLDPHRVTHGTPAPRGMRISSRHSGVAGSPAYMAPEQWERERLDPRTDVWACGVVMYQLLTGALPFTSPRAVMLGPDAPRIDILRPDVPTTVADIVHRCLQRSRVARYESAAALLDALDAELQRAENTTDIRGEPYRYLESFTEEDAGWFFGRDREVKRLALMLQQRPIVAVVGASGAGKTSLLRAGLLPVLRHGADGWDVLSLTPGKQPFSSLVEKVEAVCETCAEAVIADGALDVQHPGRIGQLVRRHAHHTGNKILLVVDQFEELFTQGAETAQRQAFTTAILSAADDINGPVRLVISMREDFLTRLIEAPDLRDAVAGNMLPLGVPDEASIREAVCAPALRFGYTFDPAVLDAILADVRTEPAPLPMVQFAISQLWERRDSNDRRIGLDLLEAIGGVAGVLAAHAESLFHGLSADTEVPIARALLLELVTEHGTKRRVARQQLLQATPDEEAAKGLLALLVRGRLLTTLKKGDIEYVQLAHESLITRWQRLRDWLRKDEDARRFRDGVREAADRWHRHDRQPGLLWSGAMQEAAADWRLRWPGRLTAVEADFLDATEAAATRAKRVRQGLVIGALTTALLVALGSMFATLQYRHRSNEAKRAENVALRAEAQARQMAAAAESARKQAQDSADEAKSARARAVSKVVAAYAAVTIDKDPLLAMLLAREAVAAGATAEAMTALHRTLRASRQRRIVRGASAGNLRAVWLGVGDRFITWGDDGPARLWRGPGEAPLVLGKAGTDVAGVAPCAPGQRVGIRHGKGGATILDLQGNLVAELATPGSRLRAFVYSPDGAWLAGADDHGGVHVWDAAATLIRRAPGRVPRTTVAWRSDSKQLAAGDASGTLEWFGAGGRSEHRAAGHKGAVSALAWVPDGRVISGGQDALVIVWQAGRQIAAWRGHKGWVTDVRVDRAGRRVATASYDETARLWELDSGASTVLEAHDYIVSSVAFSPADGRVLTTSFDGTAATWSREGKLETRLSGHERPVLGGAWSADGARILTYSEDGTARIWRSNDEEVFAARAIGCELGDVVASPSGEHLVTLPDLDATRDCEDGQARLWRIGDHRPIALARDDASPSSAAFAPQGQHFATGDEAGRGALWALDGKRIAVLVGHRGAIRATAFDASGAHVYTASHDGTARKWSRDGTMQAVFGGHGAAINALEVCGPDAIVTASSDGNGRIWRPSGKPVAWLSGHEGPVEAVACGGSAGRVATLGSDGDVRLWRLDGSPMGVVSGDAERLRAMTWMADGRLAVASATGRLRVADARGKVNAVIDTGAALSSLGAHSSRPLLLVGTRDGAATVWRPDGTRHSAIEVGATPTLATRWLDNDIALVATRDAGAHVVATDARGLLATAVRRSVRHLSKLERRRYGLSEGKP